MATTYDKASLVMIPSGVKESKLYSIKPTDGSGDFTFSRGTDTATRVNASGLIEKERSNQLLQSNTFDTTWTTTSASVTGGQSGYDGSSDAWLLEKVTGGARFVSQTISQSGVQTFSVYMSAGNTDWALLLGVAGSTCSAYFDLTNGLVGDELNIIDSSIESVGGDWYRCSITFNDALTQIRIYPASGDGSVADGAGDNIYIQDAQLEQGLVATDYIETTTAAVYEGITDNLPRLDYSGGASCPSLLLEPSRTNSIGNSEYSAGFALVNFTRTQNSTTSPEGVINASTLSSNTTNGGHYFGFNAVAATSGSPYTGSLFVKKDTGRYFQLLWGSGAFGTTEYANFDLEEGVVSFEGAAATASIEPFVDGWYRVSITSTATSTASETFYGSAITSGTSARIEVHSTALSYFIYGVQLEENASYPTSYIPTYGTSASRAGDSCVKTGISDLIGQTEGTILLDLVGGSNGVNVAFRASDGTNNNRVQFEWSGSATANYIVSSGGSIQALISSISCSQGTRHKIALAYKQNDFVVYLDGSQVGSDTSGAVPTSLTQIEFSEGAAYPYTGDVNQNLLFKTRLTNAELAALTTL